MRKAPSSFAFMAVVGGVVACSGVGLAETAAQPPSDSPYHGGPPPVTDGYTDTSQGGTKTSGDAPIPPPSKDGKVESLKGTLELEVPSTPPTTVTPGAGD